MRCFAELVASGQVNGDLYVKQLFGLINLQIRRLSQGQGSLPEAMLRDALFFIAAASAPRRRRPAAAPRLRPGRRGAARLRQPPLRPHRSASAENGQGSAGPDQVGLGPGRRPNRPPNWKTVSIRPWPPWPAPANNWARPRWPSCCVNWAAPPATRSPPAAATSSAWRWPPPCCSSNMASTRCASCPRILPTTPKWWARACWRWPRARRRPTRPSGRASCRARSPRARPWPCWPPK